MTGVVPALNACEGEHSRGFTFVGARGPGKDLFVSFHDLRLAAQLRAAHYAAAGLGRGDRVALVIPEGDQFIPAFLGALWGGLIPVPLYPPLSLGKLDAFMDSLVSILNVAKPRVLVTNERVAKVLWSAVGRIPSIEKVLTTEELAKDAGALPPAADVRDDEVAFLQFTSGSTALPKGVMVTHGSLAANCAAIVRDGLRADGAHDVAVSWLPLYHDMGLIGFVMAPICFRIPAVFIATMSFIKNATIWLETLHKHRGTLTFAPNFAYALVTKRARPEQIARWDLSRMRAFGCGAEPINPETMRAFVAALAPAGLKPETLLPCYGMAEATLAISFVPIDEPLQTDRIDVDRYHRDHKAAPVSNGGAFLEVVNCGRTFPGHELSIQDEDGRILPDRHVGEVCFRGPSVSAGYWESPEATKAAFRGGWLRTGDLGYLVADRVFVSGRIKDILIVNGRNYYPQRIEWLVDEIPGVRKGSAVVFTRPGSASEEIVVAVESRIADPPALKAQIVSRISEEFQLAVSDVALVAPGALPKTSSGKLQRRKTREQYLNGTIGRVGRGGTTRLAVARHLALSWVGRARHEVRKLFGG
jgi:acyl-CoA synthetase (AMP-forming)/AMP-acid ligase II